jgi:hypothetical protein
LFVHAEQEGREGSYFVFWEYNRSDYLTSDIRFKGAYTNLWDVHTTGQKGDHAEQVIWFAEFYSALGFYFGRIK